jgi:uncharacterized protein YjbI with pentapeptide repeats
MPTTNVNGWIDVTANGADPTGTTDSTGAISVSINSAATLATAVVFFPPGTYNVCLDNVPLSAVPSNVTLQGCGPETSVIRCTSTSTNILKIESSGTGYGSGVLIKELGLTYETAAEAGTAAIWLQDAQTVRIRDVEIANASTALYLLGSTTGCCGIYCERVKVKSPGTGIAGLWATQTTGQTASAPNNDIHLLDCVFVSDATSTYGMYLENASEMFLTSCEVTGYAYGLLVHPSINVTGTYPYASSTTDLFFANCAFRANSLNAYLGPVNSTNVLARLLFTNCLFANSAQQGLAIYSATGRTCSGLGFTFCSFIGNGRDGLLVSVADHMQIAGCNFYGNNQDAGSYNGLTLDGAKDVVVGGCLITGQGGEYSTGGQEYAVKIADCTNIVVSGCDLSGASASPVSLDASSGPTTCITSNAGYNPVGLLPVPPTVPSTGHYVRNTFGTAANVFMTHVTVAYISTSSTFGDPVLNYSPAGGSGPLRVQPGEYLKIDYTTTPTWQWFLD